MNGKLSWFGATSIILGFAFLYLPIVVLVIYSFNASSLVTVWGGFSTKWYVALYDNQPYWDAAWVTIRLALISSLIATVLGTMGALAIVRYAKFPGRTLFTGMTYAPLVMPEVISGLALLLLFIAIGADRGFATITIAHVTLSMCYVSIVVASRLATFDGALEEAALDLGATPLSSFFLVTLPNIAPAVVSAWLLSITISLDNLVTSSFTTGPSATTLPMVVYSQVRLGVNPQINALSTILIGIVFAVTILVALSGRRQTKRMEADMRKASADA
ncbi:MAG: ABC transporter permease [Paracoccaceae bacterium]